MGRSVRRASVACVVMLPATVILTGCVSTQQIAARARLVSARVRASESATRVTRSNPDVTVGRLALIRARAGTAIVATLHNNSSSTLTDLPISVGIHTQAHRTLYLNDSANLDYFEAHVAAIEPDGSATWVFTTDRRVTVGRPFATVGFSQLHPSAAARLPRVDVSVRAGRSAHGSAIAEVSVANRSGIPQYGLQVYVVAMRAARDVGTGRAEVTHLGADATTTLAVPLLGATRRVRLRAIALPTIFS